MYFRIMKKAIVLGIVVAVASYMALDTFDPGLICFYIDF